MTSRAKTAIKWATLSGAGVIYNCVGIAFAATGSRPKYWEVAVALHALLVVFFAHNFYCRLQQIQKEYL